MRRIGTDRYYEIVGEPYFIRLVADNHFDVESHVGGNTEKKRRMGARGIKMDLLLVLV